MSQIAVYSNDEQLFGMLRNATLQVSRIDGDTLAGYAQSAHAPSALVVDVRQHHMLPAALAAVKRAHPQLGVVLVVASLDPRLMLEAMRLGVTECVAEPLTLEAVEDSVRRVVVGAAPESRGQMFAFVGAKGGVGASTLAVNTAAALAKASSADTLLVDLHVVHGDTAVFLGAEPRFSVLDALENVHRVDESFFGGLVEKTKLGVHLLASSNRPLTGAIDPRRTRTLLEFATTQYRFAVLDVPRSDMAMLDSLDAATSIVVVTSQEVPALRSAAHIVETLRQRYGSQRVRVVVNRYDGQAVVGTKEVARVMGEPVKHLIPSDYRVAVEAVNTGRPIVRDRDSKLAKALISFARDLASLGKDKPEPQAAGMLARLAWRRA